MTRYEYWPAGASCPGAGEGVGMDKGCRGQLMRVTNAAGHVTDYLKYDAHGQVLALREANGVAHAFVYDPRGRLLQRTEGERVTAYAYDQRGLVTRITAPDGSYIEYAYDDAHRLIGVGDAAGNSIVYALDAAGNRIEEAVEDAAGVLRQALAREYDALSRMKTETLGAAQ